ncbi:MAG: VOC family protein [Quisquiliibacterium sp.]
MNAGNDSCVCALAYLGVAVDDPAAWMRFATDVLGAMPADPGDGADRLRIDQRAWRIAVQKGAQNDLAFAGFEVANQVRLAALNEHLTGLGIATQWGDAALVANRGVTALLRCTDPGGTSIEICCGATERFEQPFISPAGVSGFVTGDQGLGHIVLGCEDIDAMRRFYVEGLGLRLSDRIRMSISGVPVQMEFFHCNARHHSLALVPLRRQRGIFHFMLQAASLDDVGFAYDRVLASGDTITATLGRHTNDHMFSFYAATPGGIEVEFGYGARTVDDATWCEGLHHKPSMWGHKRG